MNDANPADDTAALWELIMKLADPRDLLRSILNNAGEASAPTAEHGATVVRHQTLLITECQVTIHQQVATAGAAL